MMSVLETGRAQEPLPTLEAALKDEKVLADLLVRSVAVNLDGKHQREIDSVEFNAFVDKLGIVGPENSDRRGAVYSALHKLSKRATSEGIDLQAKIKLAKESGWRGFLSIDAPKQLRQAYERNQKIRMVMAALLTKISDENRANNKDLSANATML